MFNFNKKIYWFSFELREMARLTQFSHCRRMCINDDRLWNLFTHPMHHRALFGTHAHSLLWYHFTNTWQRVTKPWSFETDQIIVSHWNGIRTKNNSRNKNKTVLQSKSGEIKHFLIYQLDDSSLFCITFFRRTKKKNL